MKNDNSIREAKLLFELIKSKIKDNSLRLFVDNYKSKYVYFEELRDYSKFEIIEDMCSMNRETSDIYGKDDEGLNRDGWKFRIVGRWNNISTHTVSLKFFTWFKNRHTSYGNRVHAEGWSTLPYLNINNLGIEFDIPKKMLIEDRVE